MAQARLFPTLAANVDPAATEVPLGGYVCRAEPVTFDEHKLVTKLKVRNTGDRPVQVGSHFHFFEVNDALEFERRAAFGMRLDIPAGTAVRFEPGDEREVELVALGGTRSVHGLNRLTEGGTEEDRLEAALGRAASEGFGGAGG